MNISILPRSKQIILCLVSWLIVAFGQPAWNVYFGIFASAIGYALFWRVLLCYPSKKERFYLATSWFTLVQLVQLSWFISHPYYYIFSVYFIVSLLMGIQFGLLGIFIDLNHLRRFVSLLAIAGLWVLFEWSRLFLLSGLSWNPLGLALSGNYYSLQAASIAGAFGLSFWVILVNLLALKAWCFPYKKVNLILWVGAATLPYLFGFAHVNVHESYIAENTVPTFNAVLVQTNFPLEEELGIKDREQMVNLVISEWRQILNILKKQLNNQIDLIVLPEFVVPYGTYSFVFPYEVVREAFIEAFGNESLSSLPALELPLAYQFKTSDGRSYNLVNNAFWSQAIANHFNTGLLIGLEDAEQVPSGNVELYSAALYFRPSHTLESTFIKPVGRYEKRILVPMGEYIPFAFCRTLAAAYGVQGSFTSGKNAKVFNAGNNVPFGISICYEETFGNIVRENKHKGAILLTNLTNDAWYPNSRLTRQHFDHARLRTVECGIPLIRACNTGITGAIDSLGRDILVLNEYNEKSEPLSDSLHVSVPLYHFSTLYTFFGDSLVVGLSMFFVIAFLRLKK